MMTNIGLTQGNKRPETPVDTTSMSIWLIEDEEKLLAMLASSLRTEGFLVRTCASIEEAEALVRGREPAPDLVVLDRLLHNRDGIDFIEPLRSAYPDVKILILSAINTAVEKAAALDRGADDYLAKPFSSVELLARMRALGRRPSAASAKTAAHIKFGNLLLDTIARSVIIEDKRYNLPNKEFLLLRTFIEHPGKVFSKQVLFEQVWDISADAETNVVEATINNLRKRLRDMQANAVIKNMRNAGYWIEA